jgi:hypothetical protein
MVKVLCYGGPGYWIKRPCEEQAAFDSPDPNARPKGYSKRRYLMDGEMWSRELTKGFDMGQCDAHHVLRGVAQSPEPGGREGPLADGGCIASFKTGTAMIGQSLMEDLEDRQWIT